MEKKIVTKFFVFQIISFELGVANSHILERDTCHRQSMCQQTSLRFHLTLGETYSKSTSRRMIKEHDKSALWDFGSSWDAFSCWLPKPFLKWCSWESFLTKIFRVCNFRNTLAMTIIFSFKIFKIVCRIQKSNKKFRKSFLFSR